MKWRLKKDDVVVVTAGKDKGKTGRILKVNKKKNSVLVEGVNMMKKAQRRRNQNESGGIVDIEAPIHISNVMYAFKGNKGSRIRFQLVTSKKQGGTEGYSPRVNRIAQKSGEVI